MKRTITAYRVKAGTYAATYATDYHARQMADALTAHGRKYGYTDWTVTVEPIRLPDDALTALTVRGMQS